MHKSPTENREATGGILGKFRGIRTAVATSMLALFGCATVPEAPRGSLIEQKPRLSAPDNSQPEQRAATPERKAIAPKPEALKSQDKPFDLRDTLRELSAVAAEPGLTASQYLAKFHVYPKGEEVNEYLARLVNIKNGKLLGHTPKNDRDVIAGASYVLAPDAETAREIRSALLNEKKVIGKNATESVTVMKRGQGPQEFVQWVVSQLREKMKGGKISRADRHAAASWDFFAELLGQNAWKYLYHGKTNERLTDPKRLMLGQPYYLKVTEAELIVLYGLHEKKTASNNTSAKTTEPNASRQPSEWMQELAKAAKATKAAEQQAELDAKLRELAASRTESNKKRWGNYLKRSLGRDAGGDVGTATMPKQNTPKSKTHKLHRKAAPEKISLHQRHRESERKHTRLESAMLNNRKVTLQPEALRQLIAADERLKSLSGGEYSIRVISSHRTLRKQEELWKKYNGIKPVAYPGRSYHNIGLAIDNETSSKKEMQYAEMALAAHGYVREVANDRNHFIYVGVRSAKAKTAEKTTSTSQEKSSEKVVSLDAWREQARQDLGKIFIGLDKKHLVHAKRLLKLAEQEKISIEAALEKYQAEFPDISRRYYLGKLTVSQAKVIKKEQKPGKRKKRTMFAASGATLAKAT